MALVGLCTYQNVVDRMKDLGLATASSEDSDTVELVERKILQVNEELELDLTAKVQRLISPYQTDAYDNTPALIVSKITAEGKAYLKRCATAYAVRACFEEGDVRFRFRFAEAGDTIDKVLKRWDALCSNEFEKVFPLLTYDQDGSGTVSLMERAFSNILSSIRVTA